MRWMRWAAALLLACSLAGAAYAIPGSPLPRWLGRLRAQLASPGPTIVPPPAGPPVTSGIAVPAEARLTIRFTAPQTTGSARVRLVEGASVAVRTLDGTAVFATGPEALTIDNRGSAANYEIDLPSSSRRVVITLAGRILFLKQDTLVNGTAAPPPAGGYLLPLTEPP